MRNVLWAASALGAAAVTGAAHASPILYTSQTRTVEASATIGATTDSDSDTAIDFGPFPATVFAEVNVGNDEAFASASTASSLDPMALSASGSVNAVRFGSPASAFARSFFEIEFTLETGDLFDLAVGATNSTWSITGPGGTLYQTGEEDLDLTNLFLPAGDYIFSFETIAEVDSAEGTLVSTGSWSVVLVLVPAPGIPTIAGMAALVAMRRRR